METLPHETIANDQVRDSLEQRLVAIEQTLTEIREMLLNQRRKKDWYSVSEVASILGKADWTVREWCRLGRVYASKRDCGRGNAKEWIVSDEELRRIENEGLLPL